jgi:uncharacterized phiE125 gp8 family phage protein
MINQLKTAPATEPVTLAEMRAHLGITRSDDISRDGIISGRIISARQWAETYTRIAFIKQTWTAYAEDFPGTSINDGKIALKKPLIAVTSVKYLDVNGLQQTLDPAGYYIDTVSGYIMPAFGESWPSVREQDNSLQIEYICGYGLASAVPTETVTAGTYTAAASTTATDKWKLTIDGIIVINAAVGAGGVLAAALQSAIDAFAAANSAFYTVTGSVAGANLKIAKLDGTEIVISASFTDATGLLPAVGTTSGGTFAGAGFIGTTSGAGAAAVPESIKEAIKFIVGQWEVFQSSIEGVMRPFTIPNAAKELLNNYVDMRAWF